MVSEKRKIGDIGEAVAARYLSGRGYRIVERNYLKKWGEIDIVAEKSNILHFVEVKTVQARLGESGYGSRETAHYNPAENVHPKKLERLYRAAETYLEDRKVPRETDWQIDVVSVLLDLDAKKAKVDLLKNIV